MGPPTALIRELQGKVDHLSSDRRTSALRHLTDLYLVSGQQLSDDELRLIDDIFVRLVEAVELSARALLAIRLGPVAGAPPKVLRLLACDDAIDVASPVLMQSPALDDAILIECATTKSQDHLLAISQRKTLSEAVTDVLVRHGDRDVMLSTAKNAGARLSASGFGIFIKRADGDDVLVDCIGSRPDFPPALFERLLEAASERVRAKLKAEHPFAAREVDRAVVDITERLRGGTAILPPPARTPAQEFVHSLNRTGRLNPARLVAFAKAGQFNTLIAALALMAYAPDDVVAEMVNAPEYEPLLILARAIGLSWETTKTIFIACRHTQPLRPGDLEKCSSAFHRLDRKAARKILDFRCANPQSKTLN